MKSYYVYKIQFDDHSYYIGYRGSKYPANQDFLIKYFSSSKVVNNKIKHVGFTGEILQENLEKEIAYEIEQKLINHCISDPQCLNKVSYYMRKGFGCISESAREKIKQSSAERWQDPEYRKKLSESHKKRWQEKPELRDAQSKRQLGKKCPEHSARMKGRKLDASHPFCTGEKSEAHKNNIAKALKGKSKSEEHKAKFRVPKLRCCRLSDRKEVSVNSLGRYP